MGRWRPKGIPASKYITVEGYHKLNDELQYLWKDCLLYTSPSPRDS